MNQNNLTAVVFTIQRLEEFLKKKYGSNTYNLTMMTPALKPVLEFFCAELDELNARVDTIEQELAKKPEPSGDNEYEYPYYF